MNGISTQSTPSSGPHRESAVRRIRQQGYIPEDLLELLTNVDALQTEAHDGPEIILPAADQLASGEDVLKGRPLLERSQFPLNMDHALTLLPKVLDLACRAQDPLGKSARALRQSLDNNDPSPAELLGYVFEDNAFFQHWAEQWPESPRTAYFVAYNALLPGIRAASRALAQRLPDVKTWTNGTCPICGGLPLVSVLREKQGFRHALCSFCRHEFRIRRLACPVCGTDEQERLKFFTAPEVSGVRVDVCTDCNHYTKTLDFRELDRVPVPEYDDLGSLVLDYLAREQGYSRPTYCAWGF